MDDIRKRDEQVDEGRRVDVSTLTTDEVQTYVDELQKRNAELTRENEDLRYQREQALGSLRSEQAYVDCLNFALDTAGVGKWEVWLNTYEIRFDEQCSRLFGCESHNGLTVESLSEYIHPDDRKRVEERFQTACESACGFEAEYRLLREEGGVRWLAMYGGLSWNIEGESGRMTGVVYEISAQKQTGAKLRESEARLRALIENLPVAFWAMDAEGRYVVQNELSRKQWGKRIGKTPGEIAPSKEVLELWQDENKRAFAGELVDEEVRSENRAKSGIGVTSLPLCALVIKFREFSG